MAKVLIVGAGGVGQVVTHKCAQVPAVHVALPPRLSTSPTQMLSQAVLQQ